MRTAKTIKTERGDIDCIVWGWVADDGDMLVVDIIPCDGKSLSDKEFEEALRQVESRV